MELSLITKAADVAVAPFDLSEVREIYAEIMAAQEEVGGTITYRAKIPSGGKSFDILTGNEDMDTSTPKLVGVVIHSHKCNAMFEEGSRNSPPLCSSVDGVIGCDANGEHVCEDCPMNQYGTAKGGAGAGKACKNMIRIYMMTEGCPIPLVLTLAPTSLAGWQSYRLGVLGPKRLKPHEVVTEFSIKLETSRGGDQYSVVRPKLVGLLPDAAKAHAAYFASGFQPKVVMEADDYNRGDVKNE